MKKIWQSLRLYCDRCVSAWNISCEAIQGGREVTTPVWSVRIKQCISLCRTRMKLIQWKDNHMYKFPILNHKTKDWLM